MNVWWASYARIVRGLVLAIREREFIVAARALGASDHYIVVRYVLPNILAPVAILATVEMGELIGFNLIGDGLRDRLDPRVRAGSAHG